ncbi:CidA/LrgA family protein [Orrella daihaiensis]|uniref:CidA/LrgA family protein n=1 Tax=Orrella daihaiensis TaxID=2782176 RepID=A0ABY4AJX4_9BURK|nr:CidA/LrgA family protein [Orrella daihaiensis]UOD49700.1 CidA/LrgA family protein [Orrella daihaiensis]
MAALVGFTLLLLYQVAGEVIARLFGLDLPGPVLGLMLLWPSLWVQWIRERVAAVAGFLLSNLSLLFIPVGVGVILHLELLSTIWWQIAVALLASTILGLITTVVLLRVLIRESVDAPAAGQEDAKAFDQESGRG